MATETKRASLNLGLPSFPAATGLPTEVYQELLDVISAIDKLTYYLDEISGLTVLSQEERELVLANNNIGIPKAGDLGVVYREFSEACTKGQVVQIDASTGLAIKALSGSADTRCPLGILISDSVIAGEFGAIATIGVTITNLTTLPEYGQFTVSGTAGNLTTFSSGYYKVVAHTLGNKDFLLLP